MRPRAATPLRRAAACAAAVLLALPPARPVRAQQALYYEQVALPASHNRAFRARHGDADRLFNAFDYGHAVVYEALISSPGESAARLEGREFAYITGELLPTPPRFPLPEAAIGPSYARLAPELVRTFEWAHQLHRQLYDILADERLGEAERDRRVAAALRYYRSRPDLALASAAKHMALMEEQPYSLAFRERHPRFNGLLWSYHWYQMALYDALLADSGVAPRATNVRTVVARFRAMTASPGALPSVMPMSAAVAPAFTARWPEAAAVFDNLHALHDVAADILASPAIPRGRKRAMLLRATAAFRDATSDVYAREEWLAMSLAMGVEAMGGSTEDALAGRPLPVRTR
jgi:hypothetical protein